jgi:predicted phosphoribosyltransferase
MVWKNPRDCIKKRSIHFFQAAGQTKDKYKLEVVMFFEDRMTAAKQLAAALSEYRGKQPLILAIPRGAVQMAKVIADELDGDLDVVLVRKLRAPHHPEFAIGSVDESGWIYLGDYASSVGATQQYIDSEISTQLEVMRQRRAQYTPVRPPIDPASRVVIVVDDGLATGSTMISALHAIRAKNPRELICAVPVASSDALKKVEANADRVVCLSTPVYFQAVGQFYREFPQVADEEVIAILAGTAQPQGGQGGQGD